MSYPYFVGHSCWPQLIGLLNPLSNGLLYKVQSITRKNGLDGAAVAEMVVFCVLQHDVEYLT